MADSNGSLVLECPKCGSDNITSAAQVHDFFGTPLDPSERDMYICQECNHLWDTQDKKVETDKDEVDQIDVLCKLGLPGIVRLISREWLKVTDSAYPYLQAMALLDSIDDEVGVDNGRSIVSYFLANAEKWQGDTASAVKQALQRMVDQDPVEKTDSSEAAEATKAFELPKLLPLKAEIRSSIAIALENVTNDYFQAHEYLFRPSLDRIDPTPGIFEKIDFPRLLLDLQSIESNLPSQKNRLENLIQVPDLHSIIIESDILFLTECLNYITQLQAATNTLIIISKKLILKTQGDTSYTSKQYCDDLEEWDEQDDATGRAYCKMAAAFDIDAYSAKSRVNNGKNMTRTTSTSFGSYDVPTRYKMIYVDDDPFCSDRLKSRLAERGYDGWWTENGKTGLSLVNQFGADVVLVRLLVPGIDGLDLLKRIKANQTTKKIPVFILSNMSDNWIVQGAKDLGVEAYLNQCDLSLDQIADAIDAIMSKNYQSRVIRSPKDILITPDLQAIFDRLDKEYGQTNKDD